VTFNIEELNLSDVPLEAMDTAFDNWDEALPFQPPPSPGPQSAIIDPDSAEVKADLLDDNTQVIKANITFLIRGGKDDNGRVSFVRVSSKPFTRRGKNGDVKTSQIMDIVKSTGYAEPIHSLKDLGAAFNNVIQMARLVRFDLDWRGFCSTCYANKLIELTKSATIEEAKQKASLEQIKLASKFATKAKSYRAFPSGTNGDRMPMLDCPVCGSEVRAQANITRYLAPMEIPF
jgi:hypothetical protein